MFLWIGQVRLTGTSTKRSNRQSVHRVAHSCSGTQKRRPVPGLLDFSLYSATVVNFKDPAVLCVLPEIPLKATMKTLQFCRYDN